MKIDTMIKIDASLPFHFGILIKHEELIKDTKGYKKYMSDIKDGSFFIKFKDIENIKEEFHNLLFIDDPKKIETNKVGIIFKKKYPQIYKALIKTRLQYSSANFKSRIEEYKKGMFENIIPKMIEHQPIPFYIENNIVFCTNFDLKQVKDIINKAYNNIFKIQPYIYSTTMG